jgi:GMP reductase
MQVQVGYNYKDILLQPNYSALPSRSKADTSIQFGPRKFDMPICISNMKTVIDENLAAWCAEHDLFYVMHRFNVDPVKFCEMMMLKGLYTSISLGVNEDSYQQLESLVENHITPDYITIDIAHGWCEKMQLILSHINEAKFRFPWFKPFVIAGNVCVPEAVTALEDWGADCVKIGIGPGSVCTTKLKTGFSHPQFSAVLNCAAVAQKPTVADGGIEHNGDIAKALVAGGDMVMAGGIFAGFDESPGSTVTQLENGHEVKYKEYFGSASEHNKGEKKNVEGRRILVPYRGPIADKFKEIKQDLQSSISYAGGDNLGSLLTVKWVVVH